MRKTFTRGSVILALLVNAPLALSAEDVIYKFEAGPWRGSTSVNDPEGGCLMSANLTATSRLVVYANPNEAFRVFLADDGRPIEGAATDPDFSLTFDGVEFPVEKVVAVNSNFVAIVTGGEEANLSAPLGASQSLRISTELRRYDLDLAGTSEALRELDTCVTRNVENIEANTDERGTLAVSSDSVTALATAAALVYRAYCDPTYMMGQALPAISDAEARGYEQMFLRTYQGNCAAFLRTEIAAYGHVPTLLAAYPQLARRAPAAFDSSMAQALGAILWIRDRIVAHRCTSIVDTAARSYVDNNQKLERLSAGDVVSVARGYAQMESSIGSALQFAEDQCRAIATAIIVVHQLYPLSMGTFDQTGKTANTDGIAIPSDGLETPYDNLSGKEALELFLKRE